jgi:peroxiredoxin
MTISVGKKIPAGRFDVMRDGNPAGLDTSELFDGKTVVLISVPGAYTPTCSMSHLPGFVALADEILERGVDTIACMAVNDVFVMDAWGRDQGVGDKVLMLADGNGDYVKALGLDLDGRSFGMGIRGQRFAMIVDDGTVTHLAVEEPAMFAVSKAEAILGVLQART